MKLKNLVKVGLIHTFLLGSSLTNAAGYLRQFDKVEEINRVRLVPNFSDELNRNVGQNNPNNINLAIGDQIANAVRQVEEVLNSRQFEDALKEIHQDRAGFQFIEELNRQERGRVNPVKIFRASLDTGETVLKTIRKSTLPGVLQRPDERPSIITFGIDTYATNRFLHSSVTGYTDTTDNNIFFNLRNHNTMAVENTPISFFELCNTVAHELMHTLNYTHTGGNNWEADSVPYVIGDIVEQLLREQSIPRPSATQLAEVGL